MANKENLSPHSAAKWYDSSKSPLLGTSNTSNQQQPAAKPPPFGLLSPSNNSTLSQQRDHSACRRTDSPLKVRKTRENLKQPSIYTDIPPPCIHGVHTAAKVCCVGPVLVVKSFDAGPKAIAVTTSSHDDQLDTSGSTLVNTGEDDNFATMGPTPAPAPAKMQRHKSVSRRMLSRVREGISHRSRSSQSMRAAGSDTGLLRRASGKSKLSSDEQPRMRSFEVSRDSVDSQLGGQNMDTDISASYRSFTDCSISTDDLMGSISVTTPPQSRPLTPTGTTHTRQYSGRLLSPSPGPRSPSGEPTPKATLKSIAFALGDDTLNLQATVPFVDVSISVERDCIDVGLTRDMWVAVEGTVRSRVVEACGMPTTEAMPLRKRPMDAIIIVTQDAFESERKSTHKCIVELCSRLNVAGDRLAVLCARIHQTGTTTVDCECDQLHALQTPSLTRLFERLGIAPSTADIVFEEHWRSLPDSLKILAEKRLRSDHVQTFVISRSPDLLVQIIDHLVLWPAHALKIGLASERAAAPTPRTRHNWAIQIKGDDGDDDVEIFDNMIKDLRHGYPLGTIPSLRMCYKPTQGCRVLEVLGQKALRDVRLGQRCSLFLKVQVPRIDMSRSSIQHETADSDSLFAELESIVGTLETKFMHVEARYRHSLLPSESVVTIRHMCSIRRPKGDSRWSLVGNQGDASTAERVQVKLAQFLAMHYPPARALRMIDRWVVQQSGPPSGAMWQIRNHLGVPTETTAAISSRSASRSPDSDQPCVVITNIDSEPPNTVPGALTIEASSGTPSAPTCGYKIRHPESTPNTLSPESTTAAARTISAAKTTTAITMAGPSQTGNSLIESEDTARQLWRHIRHHSLSAKQRAELTPHKLEQMEAQDDAVKALRHKALKNQRSVGVETLRDIWRWEEKPGNGSGEAPWL